MKTLDEWYAYYATRSPTVFDTLDLIKAVRQEAFERCELEAYRADKDPDGIDPQWPGAHVAKRIAKVYREEGTK